MVSRVFVGFVGFVFASLLVAALPAAAQGPPEVAGETPESEPAANALGYAVIDTGRVVAESVIGRGITERGAAAAAGWEDRVAAGRQELAGLAQRRSEQRLTLNQAALAALDADINEKNVEQQRLEEDARRALESLSAELMVELNTVLGPALERFARERGFLFIFDSAAAAETGLLYWASEVDVTGEFISSIDGGVAQWRDVRNDDGLSLGNARVPESDWLRQAVFEDVLRTRRR